MSYAGISARNQCLCMGDVEIFNNIIAPGTGSLKAFLSGGLPGTPQSDYDTGLTIGHLINIHNNILFSYGVPYLFSQANKCKNVRILDNFCDIREPGEVRAADIMSGWKVEGNMNWNTRYPFDLQAIDERYKIADSTIWTIDCRLLASGWRRMGDSFPFDFNGYKIGADKVFPIGPSLGNIESGHRGCPFRTVIHIEIDGGARQYLWAIKVSVRMNCKGEVTHYRKVKRDFSPTRWSEERWYRRIQAFLSRTEDIVLPDKVVYGRERC